MADAQTAAPPAQPPEILESDFPALFTSADEISREGQRRYVLFMRLELFLLILASVFGAVASALLGAGRLAAAVGASLLVGAVLVRATNRSSQPDRKWFEGRAIAESVKTLAWKYMTHVEPMDGHTAQANDAFLSALRDVLGERLLLGSGARQHTLHMQQITPRMHQVRAMSFAQRRALYLQHRVLDQLDWYSSRGAQHERDSERWFYIGILFEVLAIASAIVLIVYPSAVSLIGVFSTATAASNTFARLRGDQEVAQRYALAAQELSVVCDRMEHANEASFKQCVGEAEAAISREHKMWAAKRS